MNGWLVALVLSIPLVAFGMWLTFNAILVKWHGLVRRDAVVFT
jgi:hypothetical protein